ncbi:BadF/BadG/BcrA/BcrD ATPase family protein [Streptomyces pathocidini]|uniref:N-acetylglucosamine kinase n=1 Tax=Streptomyces pathocidini TaxID=1650571 RepID=UPI0033F17B12
MADLVVGIDAGGTRTRAALASTAGPDAAGPDMVLGTGGAGAGNALSVPADRLTDHLAQALAAAVPPGQRAYVRAVVAGVAGCAGTPPARAGDGPRTDPGSVSAGKALRAALSRLGFAPDVPLRLHSDTEVAFAAAPGAPADGLILIAGTGAVAARVAGRHQTEVADGDGWLLGDSGSGFWIGRRGVRRALAALDGRGRATSLTSAVTAYYLGKAVETRPADPAVCQEVRARVVRAVQERPPVDLARVCPLVTAAAGEGDAVAARILDAAAERLVTTVQALSPAAGEALVTSGGLLGPGGPLLPRFTARVAGLGLRPVPVADGLPGAVALARLTLRGGGPGPDGGVLRNVTRPGQARR